MIGFSNAALPHAADFDPGDGVSSPATTSPNVLGVEGMRGDPGTDVATHLDGTTAGHPVSWWIAIIVLLVALKFVAEKAGDSGSYSNIKVGAWNTLVVTISAIIGLTFLKWVFGMYRIPGLSAIVLAA
jgi:hypothetical protein